MCHVTKYCNVNVLHCTVRRDTACVHSSPDPSLLLWKWVGLVRLDIHTHLHCHLPHTVHKLQEDWGSLIIFMILVPMTNALQRRLIQLH